METAGKMNSLKYNTHTVMELRITSTGIEISEEIAHGVLPGTTSLVCHHTTVSSSFLIELPETHVSQKLLTQHHCRNFVFVVFLFQ